MSMVGTFDGFTAARLGLYAAQHGLRVTGNNVANINTVGYTRQRADQASFKVGANDMYRSWYDNHVGSGALVNRISQLRDPYLDIRYRNASTDTYHYDTWLSGLQNIASILDEVGKGENKDGLIYKQIQDLAEKLRAYSANPTDLNNRLVRNSATSLTGLFHNAANELEKLYNETVNEFHENITAVNEILTNIQDLNKSIREAEIHGDTALEMRDERNRQIDALSQYLDIKVEYSYENVGGGVQVEKLTIRLNNANPDNLVHTDESILVDGVFVTQLSVPEERPVLNTHGKADGYGYLEGYTYLKKLSEEDALKFLEELNAGKTEGDEGYYELTDLLSVTETDEEGNVTGTYYLVGTDDPDVDGIYTEANDNFSIQLGKLLNTKGEEWKSSTTAWVEVTNLESKLHNAWTYTVSSTLEAGRTFNIGNKTYTVVADNADTTGIDNPVRLSEIAGTKFADFVAGKLKDDDRYTNFEITSKNGQITFRSKTPADELPDPDNETGPGFNVEPLGAGITVTEAGTSKVPVTVPKDVDLADYPQYKYDEHGRVTESVSYVEIEGQWFRLTVGTQYTHEITLDDNDLHGILQAQREMLTEEGEFASEKDVVIDESALTKRGLPYYMKSLDLLAQKFAQAYNQLNHGYAYNQDGNYIDKDGNELLLVDLDKPVLDEDGLPVLGDDGLPTYESTPISTDGLTAGQLRNLLNNGYFIQDEDGNALDVNGNIITRENGEPITKDNITPADYDKVLVDMDKLMGPEELGGLGGIKMGGELFTQLDGKTTTGITAKNISISYGWSNGDWALVPTFMMLFADDGSGGLTHSTKNDNADHMIAMIENSLTYDPRDLFGSDAIGPVLFQGSFNDMLSNMMAVEGEDANITSVRLTTSADILNEVDYSREGVSGVDLNDEAMNMITYSKAMSAAMRVMTVIDEMLDRLINNTAI